MYILMSILFCVGLFALLVYIFKHYIHHDKATRAYIAYMEKVLREEGFES